MEQSPPGTVAGVSNCLETSLCLGQEAEQMWTLLSYQPLSFLSLLFLRVRIFVGKPKQCMALLLTVTHLGHPRESRRRFSISVKRTGIYELP